MKVDNVGPSSRGHISKTKQDEPIDSQVTTVVIIVCPVTWYSRWRYLMYVGIS